MNGPCSAKLAGSALRGPYGLFNAMPGETFRTGFITFDFARH
jgi:hypothetical protein